MAELYERLKGDRKRRRDEARRTAMEAVDRLFRKGEEGDKVELVLGRDGRVHNYAYSKD